MKSQKLMMTRVAMLLLAVFTSMGAWAESWDSGDCQVTLEGSTLTVSGSGAMRDFQSAEEVPWRTHKDNIKTVVVGNGVTHIGVFSFYGCESLESVTIPNSVTSIGNFAFYGCHGINSLTLPDNLTTIGNNAFYNCSAIPTLNIPNSVTSIGYQAFQECYKLTSVTIGTGVTSIGYSAFEDCTHLATVVVFATSVPTLGNENVFGNNADWRDIYVPDGSLETYRSNWSAYSSDIDSYIGTGNCGKTSNDNVKWVSSGSKMVVYGSGAMADYSSPGHGPWPYATSMRVIIIIEEGVTTIGNYAFAGHGKITHTVTIPNTVQTIGTNAFSGCTNLKTLTIGSGVKTIGDHAFYNCHNIDNLTLPDGLETIGDHAFYRCSNIDNLTLPDGLETIGNDAFFDCNSIPSVTIPSSVTSIGNFAFKGCRALATVTFSDQSSVTTIGNYAFSNCAELESITIPSSVTSIGEFVFSGCGKLTSISVESGNTKYDSGNGCNAIIETSSHTLIAGCQSTTIPNTVESIGNNAFNNSALTSITIPSCVTSIGIYAFSGCGALTTVTFSGQSSVTTIGNYAFSDCAKLESITIPSSVTSIGEFVFSGCGKLTSISVESGNTKYDSGNGCNAIIETSSHTLIAGCQSTTIPNTVESIGNSAFYNCISLTSIEIPSSVTSIGDYAFVYCGALETVTFSGSSKVTSIGERAFEDCEKLESITIPSSVTSIGDYAFMYCRALATVTFSGQSSVTSIGDYAFNNCALTSIAIPSSVTSIGNYAFGGCSALATVTFSGPTSSVGSIGEGAFCWCGTLTSITLPATVTSIGQSAFESCSNLTSATLNSNPTIGEYAFGSGVALTMNLAASASNGYKWASFFNDYCNFQVDENTTVFKAKSNGEKVTLTAIADGIIPAGTAVVLRTPTDSSPVLTNTSSSTSGSYEDNELKGSSTAVTQEGAHTYYALAVKSGNVGLYKVKSNAQIPAGKAYLEDVIATTRDFLAFEDSEPTGIVDGRWNMEEGRGDGWYTLDGRKLNGKPKKKGMYVVNGNKVVIK